MCVICKLVETTLALTVRTVNINELLDVRLEIQLLQSLVVTYHNGILQIGAYRKKIFLRNAYIFVENTNRRKRILVDKSGQAMVTGTR